MEIGKINVQMTVAEYNKIKALIDRDAERPFIREKIAGGKIDRCPKCKKALGEGQFCPYCGQRIDMKNMAF
ncbi:MAG: hypothetical protein IIY21_22175 [Clostridiales bacterium]|nr:hypothetical protein [Clostridiales bacterium]